MSRKYEASSEPLLISVKQVAGFLNLDGLPYPFFKQRKLFEKFGAWQEIPTEFRRTPNLSIRYLGIR
jgi:hypothetical protein